MKNKKMFISPEINVVDFTVLETIAAGGGDFNFDVSGIWDTNE